MKPIVEKILKSGLVDKHTAALMEKWGSLEPGSVEMVGKEDLHKASEETLKKFAEDIEDLIEADRKEMLETRLAIELTNPAHAVIEYPNGDRVDIVLFKDPAGDHLVAPGVFVDRGLWITFGDGSERMIDEVVKLHRGTEHYATQIKVIAASWAG